MSYQKSNILQEPNNYLYNGKELQTDFDIDWYDYGARFYDPQLGRWHVPDPLAEARNWLSSYQYTQNTPINRIDPNGMLDDEYKLNQDGRIEFVAKSEGSDILYATNKDGSINKNKSIELKEGTLSIRGDGIVSYKDSKGKKKNTTISYTTIKNNDSDAQKVFEFAAKNFSGEKGIEFGKVTAKKGDATISVVFTNNKKDLTTTGKVANALKNSYNAKVIETQHSHTIVSYPSGYDPNGVPQKTISGDRKFARTLPNATHIMYFPKNNQISIYDDKGFTQYTKE